MSEQKDRPDREKIARELCPDKAGWDANIRDVYVDHEKYRRQADQILARLREVVEGGLPRPKSILAEAAYTGGDVPKKWINDRGNYIQGYNDALKETLRAILKAMED